MTEAERMLGVVSVEEWWFELYERDRTVTILNFTDLQLQCSEGRGPTIVAEYNTLDMKAIQLGFTLY